MRQQLRARKPSWMWSSRSVGKSSRRRLWSQAKVRSTTRRSRPSPEPCTVWRRAMIGSFGRVTPPRRNRPARCLLGSPLREPEKVLTRDLRQLERTGRAEREPSAADALELEPEPGAGEALAEDEQACLEVVRAGREPEVLVEAELAVLERGAPVLGARTQELPEDPAIPQP